MIQVKKLLDSEATHSGGGDTLYTYYRLDLKNCSLPWDYTIEQNLAGVKKTLERLDVFLDDDTDEDAEFQVIITGIGLTRKEYREWLNNNGNGLPERFSRPSTPISHTQGGDGFLEWLDSEIDTNRSYIEKCNELAVFDRAGYHKGCTLSLCAAKEKYLSRASQREQVGGLRWVKCLDRLPDVGGKRPVRNLSTNDFTWIVCKFGQVFIDVDACGQENEEALKTFLNGWEWLDESPAPPAPTDKALVKDAPPIPEFEESIENMDTDSKIFVDMSLAIASRIKQCMETKDWMQKDLAEKLAKTDAEISKWLAGMHNFTLRTICKLEAALGCDIIHVPDAVNENVSPSNTEVLEMHLRGRKLPSELRFAILSAMNEFASISVIEWAKGEEEEDKALVEEEVPTP